MIVKYELDPEDFEFWGCAKVGMDDATEEQRQLVYARIVDAFVDDFPTKTDVNDLVWFECDGIFFPEGEEEQSKVFRCPKPPSVVTY